MLHNAVQMMVDAKVLCGFWWFFQIESKRKVARKKGMSFSVWFQLLLGLRTIRKSLYICCLNHVNQMLIQVNLNGTICNLLTWKKNGGGGVCSWSKMGLGSIANNMYTCCFWSVHEVFNLFCLNEQKCIIFHLWAKGKWRWYDSKQLESWAWNMSQIWYRVNPNWPIVQKVHKSKSQPWVKLWFLKE